MKNQSILTTLAAVLMSLAFVSGLRAYPVPSTVSRSWELDFTMRKPQTLAVKLLDGTVKWYWYTSYKVVNNTGTERIFVPEVTIATDQGDIVLANKDLPAGVFDAVKKEVGNKLLETPASVIGRILQGEDFAKEGVAIWPVFDRNVSRMTLFVSGLSGETQVIKEPQTGKEKILAKNLMCDYDLPGNSTSPQEEPAVQTSKKWVMR